MRTRALSLAASVLALLAFGIRTPSLTAQTSSQSSGAITGTVIDGTTSTPVPEAVVLISALEKTFAPSRQIADERGRFAFLNLPVDGYTIAASKPGYLDGGYGRDVSPLDELRPVRIKRDEWVPDLRVTIWKPGSVSGVVRDEAGDPIVGVYVRALVRFRLQGRDEVAAGPMTLTDDRGAYRLPGLPPGRYVIQVPSVQASIPAGASHRIAPGNDPDGVVDVDDTNRLVIGRYPLPPPPVNGQPMSYATAFHPAAGLLSQAAVIDLAYGDHRTGVDVMLTPVRAVRVSGTVDAPPDALTSLTLRLLPAGLENLGQGAEVATALAAVDGRFTFLNVPSGSYTIDAPVRINELIVTSAGPRMYLPMTSGQSGWTRRADAIDAVPGFELMSTDLRGGSMDFRASERTGYSGRSSVSVGTLDVRNLVIRLRPNGTVRGQIVTEIGPARSILPPPRSFLLALDPAAGEASLGTPRRSVGGSSAREFVITAVVPGKYWIRLPRGSGWMIKSIAWKGRDYTNEPLDAVTNSELADVVVTVTTAVPELSGSVRGSADLRPEETIVIAFPTDPMLWRGQGFWPARMKTASVSSADTYEFTNLPAGEYFVAAIDRSHRATWQDAEFLAQLSGKTRVTLTWGGRTRLDLTTTVVR